MSWDVELEAFKTQIDLRQYAAAVGYKIDRLESYRSATVMRRQKDKIIVRRIADGHFLYYSFRDDHHGSIIDFVQRETDLSLGEVRKKLRLWTGTGTSPLPRSIFPDLETVGRDFVRVRQAFAEMTKVSEHRYLQEARGIPEEVMRAAFFACAIYSDHYGNAIFPHYDVYPFGRKSGGDPCGYEMKNSGFTGFSTGGMKGLWVMFKWSRNISIVVCESAIDALSHAALFPEGGFLYVSIAGQLSRSQSELITSLVTEFEPSILDLKVVAAMDSDEPGGVLVDAVLTAAGKCGRKGLQCYQHIPKGFKDWNEQLLSARSAT